MVQILECNSYHSLTLKEIPADFWQGFPSVKGLSVFLKPNLVTPKTKWDRPSTTNYKIVEILVQKLVQQKASRIVIGECGFKDQWEATMKSTGLPDLLKYPNVEIIPLQDGPNFHKFTLQRIPKGKYRSLYGVKFSDFMTACDVVINLPKMKVHNMAGMTGAIKNMMGTMAQKGSMHPKSSIDIIHKRLADFHYLTSKFVNFVVMDGIVGAQYSEQCGVSVRSNVLLSGTDQWEIDVAASKLMGMNPAKVPYLRNIRKNFDSVTVPEHLIKYYERPLYWRNIL